MHREPPAIGLAHICDTVQQAAQYLKEPIRPVGHILLGDEDAKAPAMRDPSRYGHPWFRLNPHPCHGLAHEHALRPHSFLVNGIDGAQNNTGMVCFVTFRETRNGRPISDRNGTKLKKARNAKYRNGTEPKTRTDEQLRTHTAHEGAGK